MKYKNYLSVLFLGVMLLPAFGSNKAVKPAGELDLKTVKFIELNQNFELGFDTEDYLPKGFDSYTDSIPVESINYIEIEDFDLGFETSDYLPKDFNPYKE